jgi:solute:Na+ symporter, SSS family
VATAGGDQTAIQRYMATKNVVAARRSYLVTELATLVVTVVLALLGLALLGYFSRFPEALGPGMTLARDADRLFPYFIARYIPVGLSGLLIAALLAAAMSSVDSGVNSITAVVMRDWLQRFGWQPRTPGGELRFSRWMAFGLGATVVTASMFMKHVPGNILEMTNKTANLIVTPLFALFVFALWVPFATPLGALLGCAYGIVTAVLIGFWDLLTGRPPVSFQWIGPAALLVNLAVGLGVSRWGPRASQRRRTMTVAAIGVAMLAMAAFTLVFQGRQAGVRSLDPHEPRPPKAAAARGLPAYENFSEAADDLRLYLSPRIAQVTLLEVKGKA